MTSGILKCFEKVIANRIAPIITDNSTCLQGGGKRGESTEEYLLVLQTAIDLNEKNKKNTKLLITDVKKAFDQAWRIGVFHNLAKRGITGQILKIIWEINNNIKARIKMDEDLYSKYFEVEEAIRQGSGLSAILYAQHAGKIIEELDEEDINDMAIGEMKVPAIGWQDDITVILNNENTEEEIIKKLEESAERNRIIFSEDKCKTLNIGKKDRNIVNKETIMGGIY